VPQAWLELLLLAKNGLSPHHNNRNVAHRGAGGGSRPQHQSLTLALPMDVEHWSLTTLREKLVKIGARMVRHGRNITFQLAEVAVSRQEFGQILARIARLRAPPVPA